MPAVEQRPSGAHPRQPGVIDAVATRNHRLDHGERVRAALAAPEASKSVSSDPLAGPIRCANAATGSRQPAAVGTRFFSVKLTDTRLKS